MTTGQIALKASVTHHAPAASLGGGGGAVTLTLWDTYTFAGVDSNRPFKGTETTFLNPECTETPIDTKQLSPTNRHTFLSVQLVHSLNIARILAMF